MSTGTFSRRITDTEAEAQYNERWQSHINHAKGDWSDLDTRTPEHHGRHRAQSKVGNFVLRVTEALNHVREVLVEKTRTAFGRTAVAEVVATPTPAIAAETPILKEDYINFDYHQEVAIRDAYDARMAQKYPAHATFENDDEPTEFPEFVVPDHIPADEFAQSEIVQARARIATNLNKTHGQ